MVNSLPLHAVSDEHARAVVRRHLHPETGSPFWLERDRRLGTDAYARVDGWESAQELLAFRDESDQEAYEEASRRRPVEDFIPADVVRDADFLWAAQTGGTTGLPKHATWGGAYWKHVSEFSHYAMDTHGIPRDCNWLYISPMGPHTIGRLVVDWAESRGGMCFSIDLDPRIVKIFGEEGMTDAYNRYVQHIWDQVTAVLQSQRIGVIYGTARLLEMLPEYVDARLLKDVRGVVHAGTTLPVQSHKLLREDVFPGVPVLGMYGSSTTSISWQKPFEPEDEHKLVYIPSSPSVSIDVVGEDNVPVAFGEEGRVRVWRLTHDQLLPGFLERDRARRVQPYGAAAELFPWAWIGDPFSPEFTEGRRVEGVY
ncbi:AMP-dependent synthetase [Streptomyces sp. TG1A-60]|uniref:AMP-dependent synthetase n=1 Tax=unclassified Streptomyces TaxID=2593676 RepID=UPI001B376B1C|nr:AMP-dependent synthetase [Streptomyces sp. b94]MBQ1099047.1 AMP-dependent synthetase [Streptomyces sp. b94]